MGDGGGDLTKWYKEHTPNYVDYSYQKPLTEREAWEISLSLSAKKEEPKMDTKDEIIQQLRDQITFLTYPKIILDNETMRDRFAMAALTGLLACPNAPYSSTYATKAYELADAMLEARKKGMK